MKWMGGFVNFVVGFILAIALLTGGVFLAARYVITKLTAPPPRPTFANDAPARGKATPATPRSTATVSSQAPASPSTATPSPKPALAPGTYQAKVTQSVGLVLRDAPSADASRIGGIEYNTQVIVLEESPDKLWQRVRVEGGEQEGWVKGGNVERIN